MKHIKAAAKVSKAARLKAMAGSGGSGSGALPPAPPTGVPSASRKMGPPDPSGVGAIPGGGNALPAPMGVKRGGAVKKRAAGGVVKMTAGAGTGEGRLQKTAGAKRR
jgi:hypothetical protein